MQASISLAFDARTNTGALTTIDTHGYEHVELFSVPADAPVFVVEGMDCALLREIIGGA